MTVNNNRIGWVDFSVVGEYGNPICLELVDDNSAAVDISTYTQLSVSVSSPDYLKTLTYTASLYSDGTDGKLYFTPADGDIDRPGRWHGMVKLQKTAAVAKSQPFEINVSSTL